MKIEIELDATELACVMCALATYKTDRNDDEIKIIDAIVMKLARGINAYHHPSKA